MIRREFGVQYHREHVGRLMHSLQWSPQKPERRALRDGMKKVSTHSPKSLRMCRRAGQQVIEHVVNCVPKMPGSLRPPLKPIEPV